MKPISLTEARTTQIIQKMQQYMESGGKAYDEYAQNEHEDDCSGTMFYIAGFVRKFLIDVIGDCPQEDEKDYRVFEIFQGVLDLIRKSYKNLTNLTDEQIDEIYKEIIDNRRKNGGNKDED